MLWRMYTHSAWSRLLLQESSSLYLATYLPDDIPDIPPIPPSLGATSCYVTESVPPPSMFTNLLRLPPYLSIQQRGPHLSPSSPHFSHLKNFHRDLPIHRFRPSIQRHADTRLHTLSTRPTNNYWKTGHALDPGPFRLIPRMGDGMLIHSSTGRNFSGTFGTSNGHEMTSGSVVQKERRALKLAFSLSLMGTTQK